MNPNHKKKALTIIILIITCTATFAQNRNNIDSLKTVINSKTTLDTTIIHAYLDLSSEYQDYNPDTALYYSDLALNKSLKIDYKKQIADAYRQKGEIVIYLNNYKLADSLLNKAISICREINNQYGIMKCYLNFSKNAYYKIDYRLICFSFLKT